MSARGQKRERARTPPGLSLEQISAATAHPVHDEAPGAAVPTPELFNERLHALNLVLRPSDEEQLMAVCAAVRAVAAACGEDTHRWKLLVLAIVRRRFHDKAPEAANVAKRARKPAEAGNDGSMDGGDGGADETSGGDGERLIFYAAVACLHEMGLAAGGANALAEKACLCLCRLAERAGGARDLCALLELLTYGVMRRAGLLLPTPDVAAERAATAAAAAHDATPTPQRPLRTAAAPALAAAARQLVGGANQHAAAAIGGPALDALLDAVAALLDADLATVRAAAEMSAAQSSGEVTAAAPVAAELMSTVHTWLPHSGRGSAQGSTGNRKLTQSVAELLVWERTTTAAAAHGFAPALARLRAATPLGGTAAEEGSGEEGAVLGPVRAMQTAARRLRQELSRAARAQGFSLTTAFLMGKEHQKQEQAAAAGGPNTAVATPPPPSLTLSMIRAGKAGDIATLTRLARKGGDAGVLRLLATRASDPRRAVAVCGCPYRRRCGTSRR